MQQGSSPQAGAPGPQAGAWSQPANAAASQRRSLPCERCGAPVAVLPAGGNAQCTSCGTPLSAPPRPDTRVPASPPSDELQRRQRLKAQDGKPLLPPPGLEQLMQGGRIPAHKMQEAQAIWSATRGQLAAQPADVAAAERLYFLTMLLVNTLDARTDGERVHALREGALEVMMLPRHRQLMRCQLARGAARASDIDGAEAWLAGCDPHSEDIEMDSAYRVTRAYLDTARNNPQAVLQTIGGTFEEVPIQDALDPLATVLRANAWERMGQPQNAQAVLSRFMSSGGGLSGAIEAVVGAMPQSWYVCQQSIGGARQQMRARVASRAASGGGGMIMGVVVMVAGCIPLVILATMISSGNFELPELFMLIFPVVFGGMGLRMILAARRKKEIAKGGLQGRGTITGFEGTGTIINNVPVLRFQVQCQVEGHPPIVAFTKRTMHSGQAQGLVGHTVGIIWHPKYPQEVVLEI